MRFREANKNDLKRLAMQHGISHRWKSKKELRSHILSTIRSPSHRLSILLDFHSYRGVHSVTKTETMCPPSVAIVLGHKWWAWPMARKNTILANEYGRECISAGVLFEVKSKVDRPGWRVFMGILIAVIVGSYLF